MWTTPPASRLYGDRFSRNAISHSVAVVLCLPIWHFNQQKNDRVLRRPHPNQFETIDSKPATNLPHLILPILGSSRSTHMRRTRLLLLLINAKDKRLMKRERSSSQIAIALPRAKPIFDQLSCKSFLVLTHACPYSLLSVSCSHYSKEYSYCATSTVRRLAYVWLVWHPRSFECNTFACVCMFIHHQVSLEAKKRHHTIS